MKNNPLRLTILFSIAVCIIAILVSVFLFSNDLSNSEKEVQVTNSISVNEKKAEHNFLIISTDGKYTLVSTEGHKVTEELYDVLSFADNGLYYFKQGAKQGFIDETANKIFETEDIIATNVSEEFVIYSSGDKKGYINIKTGEKINAVYQNAYDFQKVWLLFNREVLQDLLTGQASLLFPVNIQTMLFISLNRGSVML